MLIIALKEAKKDIEIQQFNINLALENLKHEIRKLDLIIKNIDDVIKA